MEKPVSIVFFDGVCGLCNRFVDFALKRDRNGALWFSPLQGQTAKTKLSSSLSPEKLDSIWLWEEGAVFCKSTAVFRILNRLGGVWRVLSVLRMVPVPIRDWVYDFVARNRYQWFGKRDSCRIPTPAERARFLD